MWSEDSTEVNAVQKHGEELLLVRLVCDPESPAVMAVENELSIPRLAHLGDVLHARAVFRTVQEDATPA
jgi:hypothetical protein